MRKWRNAAVCGLAWSLAPAMWGQTTVDLRTQSKSADWRDAARTFPARVGSGLSSECVAGEIFLRQDGESGRALHYCDTNAQWQTIGIPAHGVVGQMLCHDGTKPFWCAVSGDVAGPAADNRVVRLQGRPVSDSQPLDGWVLGWDEGSQSWTPQTAAHWQAGPGIGIADSTVGVDDAVVPQYMVGNGPATGACSPGRDSYVDITSGRLYYCGQTDTWKVVGDLTGAALLNAPNTFGAGQKQSFTPSAATAGINVGAIGGDPTEAVDGDLWYDSGSGKLRTRQNGANTDVLGGAGSSPAAGLREPHTTRLALFEYPGGGSAMSGFGDTLSPGGTGTAGTVTDGVPVHINLATGATIDNRSELVGTTSWRTGRDLRFRAALQLAETTNMRAFVGFSTGNGANMTVSPFGMNHFMGFVYDSTLGTNWQCAQDTGTGTPTTADSGVAMDTAWKYMDVWTDPVAGSVKYSINGVQVCALTSNYPGTRVGNANLRFIVTERTIEPVSKNLRVAYVYASANVVD